LKAKKRCGVYKEELRIRSYLATSLVRDARQTQIPPNSKTMMEILEPSHLVDDITGSLKML